MSELSFPPGPALTAVVRRDNTGQWWPVNYVAHALCAIADTPTLPYHVRHQAKQLGIVFHEQIVRGDKP